MTEVTDELDNSPILEEVLGDALVKLRIFHDKLAQEGEPRGLIGPRDVSIIWERHILNSAAIVPFVREATVRRQFKTVADIGSGGDSLESSQPHVCRIIGSRWWSPWNVASNGSMNVSTTWALTMSRWYGHAPMQ